MYPHFLRTWLVAAVAVGACLGVHAQAPDYKLGPGDDIRIQVFQNPDLLVETRVPESGTISYPLIGKIELGGLSVTAAQKAIADALEGGKFVKKPQVTITLGQVRGSQVSVLGQVNHPGRFPLETNNSRPSDMLAAAGGVLPTGNDVAIITGTRNGQAFRRTVDIPALFNADSSANDLILQAGDTIYIQRAPVFYIYGEAQRPGSYRIERDMTVMQALATGGGPTSRGSDTRLRLSRKNAKGELVEVTPKPTDPIQSDDVIYVKESLF